MIYSGAGTYTVNLTVTNSVGSDSELKTGYIIVTAAPVAPIAAFITDTQSGTLHLPSNSLINQQGPGH